MKWNKNTNPIEKQFKGIYIMGIKSIETLSKLIPVAQILIVLLTIFTIWASVQKGKLEKQEREKLSQQVSSTQIELGKSNKELNEIKTKTLPRKLTPKQIEQVEKELSIPSKFQILPVCRITDTEGYNFAEDLAKLFRKANWKVAEINRTFLDDISGDLTLAITNDDQIAEVDRIFRIFKEIGLNCKPENIRENSISGILPNSILLIVGSKK